MSHHKNVMAYLLVAFVVETSMGRNCSDFMMACPDGNQCSMKDGQYCYSMLGTVFFCDGDPCTQRLGDNMDSCLERDLYIVECVGETTTESSTIISPEGASIVAFISIAVLIILVVAIWKRKWLRAKIDERFKRVKDAVKGIRKCKREQGENEEGDEHLVEPVVVQEEAPQN